DLGRQAFVVHPLVDASETVEARSAVEAYDELSQVFHRYRVCLLHGRMSPTEKDDIMNAFANHEYDIMVTTTVAEVGVDIPNANIILIEGANRFGLAQLHQLRGRVGRGEHKSFCLLMPDAYTPESEQRLKAMEDSDDGFVLAEMDWQLRGAGDLMGTRQSGGHILQLAEELSPELVALARQEARTIYEEDPYLELDDHALLADKVQALMERDGGDVS
ncbi:MAG: helicase-related protein, partial [Chloroflexota bacterium]